jgi:transcriptional regulator with XRE-family HTH domain
VGSKSKENPQLLPEKLLAVRLLLQLNQTQMVALIITDHPHPEIARARISQFESGRRAPSLLELFRYAEAVRNLTEYKTVVCDDFLDDRRKLAWL